VSSELDFTDIAELVDRLDPRVVTCTYCGCVVDDIRVGHCDPPECENPDECDDPECYGFGITRL
jgi:hypothetical protein